MRVVNFVLFGVMVGLLMLIYQQKHETRRLEARAAELSREIAAQTRALAVLRAEWTYLSRPERLESIAHEKMGLVPVTAQQVVPFSEIAARGLHAPDGARSGKGDQP